MVQPTTVFLRALSTNDVERTFGWHNDATIAATLGGAFRFVSSDAELEWIKKKAAYSPSEVNLAICQTVDGSHVGNIYLRNIDWISRSAELHIFIGAEEHRGKKLGRSAVMQLLRHAFQDLNLNRVFLSVLASNLRAIRMYEHCGYQREGILRAATFKQGRYCDMVLMSILSDEFHAAMRTPDNP